MKRWSLAGCGDDSRRGQGNGSRKRRAGGKKQGSRVGSTTLPDRGSQMSKLWRVATIAFGLTALLALVTLLTSQDGSGRGVAAPKPSLGGGHRSSPSKLSGVHEQIRDVRSSLRDDVAALERLSVRTQTHADLLKSLLEGQEGGEEETEEAGFDHHKLQDVYDRLQYWSPKSVQKLPNPGHQYLTFQPDSGGLNNIRIAFEVVIVYAWMTRRTLVLPPVQPMYLLDFGKITRGAPSSQDPGRTDLGEIFDLEAISAAVPLITTEEFIAESAERFEIPAKFRRPGWSSEKRQIEEWFTWLLSRDAVSKMPWGPITNMVAFPDEQAVVKAEITGYSIIRQGRKVREYTRDLKEKPILHAISSVDYNAEDYLTYRYLGQVSSAVVWADRDLDISMKQMLKDHVHYVPLVFEAAARVIAYLGIFQYSSFHIRRNDLQYKDVFIPGEKSFENTHELLLAGEPIYLATDETTPGFFQAFRDSHPLYRWEDFFTPTGGEVLKDLSIPRKLVGPIEQVICAGGRIFFGTGTSTFSSYIYRLRGYIRAPVLDQLDHHRKYSAQDFRPNTPEGVVPGTRYMKEDPAMWILPSNNVPKKLQIGETQA